MDENNLNNNSVADLLAIYNCKRQYKTNLVDELQNCYDKCMEILDTVTVDEIDLLWQLRHMPRFSKKIIEKFVKENYEYYKFYTFKTADIISQKNCNDQIT